MTRIGQEMPKYMSDWLKIWTRNLAAVLRAAFMLLGGCSENKPVPLIEQRDGRAEALIGQWVQRGVDYDYLDLRGPVVFEIRRTFYEDRTAVWERWNDGLLHSYIVTQWTIFLDNSLRENLLKFCDRIHRNGVWADEWEGRNYEDIPPVKEDWMYRGKPKFPGENLLTLKLSSLDIYSRESYEVAEWPCKDL